MFLSDEEKSNFKINGFIKKSFLNNDQCNFYRKHFEKISKKYRTSSYKGELDDRIMNPHFFDEISRKILLTSNFFSFANELLKSEVYGVQTMYFDRGSEQSYHQDDFYLNRTIGFWIALDNVDESNGTLCIQKKSQNYEVIYPENLGVKNPQNLGDDIFYSKKILNVYKENKKNRNLNDFIVELKKGEGVIIDGRLIHWGLAIKNKKKKRRVLVLHYLDYNSKWPYKNWPLFKKNGEYKVNSFFDNTDLHPSKI